jgi:hypothetical protein
MTDTIRISHAEFARMMRRIGYPPDVVDEIKAKVPDPIDVERDAPILARYNLTRGRLMEILGASP